MSAKPEFKKKFLSSGILLRIFLIAGIFLLLLSVLLVRQTSFRIRLREGDVSLKAVYSPFDFAYRGPIDEEKTQKLKGMARDSLKDVFRMDLKPMEENTALLESFFGRMEEFKQKEEIRPEDIRALLLKELKLDVPEGALRIFLKHEDLNGLFKLVGEALAEVYAAGIMPEEEKARLIQERREYVTLIDGQKEDTVALDGISGAGQKKALLFAAAAKGIADKKVLQAAAELLGALDTKPNLIPDSKETDARRNKAALTVPPQYVSIGVKKGELIIDKGQRARKHHIDQLMQLEREKAPANRLRHVAGLSILIAVLLLITALYLAIYEKEVFNDISKLVLISVLSMGMIFTVQSIVASPLPTYAIPAASIAMLLAILLNPRVAMFMAVCLSLAVGLTLENSLNIAITILTGSIVGIYSVGNIRRRSQVIRSGFFIGAANYAVTVGLGMLNNLGYEAYGTDAAWGFANGIMCAFVVMGVLPLLEHGFNLTTNITLLELSDTNHPILKELLSKAPGTYHHSLIVGNLAEAACEAIGANSLLGRVGAYYHDIGKVEKAEYFTENQLDAKSLHDKLTPSMSRLIISNHVKDGVELAKRYKLPRAIIDFIEQHHGSGLIFYFFQKALERAEDDEILKEEGFRYPGPRPQTKETAIALLADSVEAASRSLAGPSPARLEEVVHRIINNKFIDGQLDECTLTLRDLNKIADAFVKILAGLHHTRVEYPKARINTN